VAGSEGTLGVVTRARVRLLAARPHRVVALLTFASMHALVDALAILRTRVATLEAAEFMTHGCFALGDAPLAAVPSAALLVECAGRSFPPLDVLATGVVAHGELVVAEVVAHEPGPQAVLWDLRESLGARIRAVGVPYKYDVAVPLSRLAAFVAIMPPTVALSRAARSTPKSRPCSCAAAVTAASVTPAPTVACAAATSIGSIVVSRCRLSKTSPAHGTAPPTSPLLPPCGTTATPAAWHARNTAATSAVDAGRTTANATPRNRPVQSTS
jgi:FAD/FMN-containing dehydrogenase